jgi:hypothetical protein
VSNSPVDRIKGGESTAGFRDSQVHGILILAEISIVEHRGRHPAGNNTGAQSYLGSVGCQGKGNEVLVTGEHHQTLTGVPIRSHERLVDLYGHIEILTADRLRDKHGPVGRN